MTEINPNEHRRRYILAMQAMAIMLCAGVLIVGMTVAHGFGGGLLEWAVKIGAVVLLAVAWKAIPRVYAEYFAARANDDADDGE